MVAKLAWKVAAGAATAVTAAVADKALKLGWRQMRGHEPPASAADPERSRGEALAWAGASAAVLALSRAAVIRGLASGWEKAIGAAPPIAARKDKKDK